MLWLVLSGLRPEIAGPIAIILISLFSKGETSGLRYLIVKNDHSGMYQLMFELQKSQALPAEALRNAHQVRPVCYPCLVEWCEFGLQKSPMFLIVGAEVRGDEGGQVGQWPGHGNSSNRVDLSWSAAPFLPWKPQRNPGTLWNPATCCWIAKLKTPVQNKFSNLR